MATATQRFLIPDAPMSFAQRLVDLRKSRSLSQAQMSRMTGIALQRLKRYEGGRNDPSYDALRKIAMAFNVSADTLLFDNEEREPADEFRAIVKAIETFPPEDRLTAKKVLQGLILKHQAQQWTDTG